jgi:CspA family cold shock protein
MMRKEKGFRGAKRRGFDDEVAFEPDFRAARPARPFASPSREPVAAEGPAVEATVKWFNAEKGFGFAELADGTGDAFLHIGALQAAGHDTVAPGSKLQVQVGQGAKGRQVTRVLEVDETTAQAPAPRSGGMGGGMGGGAGGPRPARRTPDLSTAVQMFGTVKWFNGDKGFGFVASRDGGKDVFVHVSVLGGAGLMHLTEGQQVSMKVVDTPKGREAVSISLAP